MDEEQEKKQVINSKPEEEGLENFDGIESLLEGIPEERRDRIIEHLMVFKSRQSPLPEPSELKEYDQIIRNGAERIFNRMEKQSDFRMDMESKVIDGELDQTKLGQKFAFIFSVLALLSAFILGYLGHDVLAGTIAGGTIVSTATVFIIGRYRTSRDK